VFEQFGDEGSFPACVHESGPSSCCGFVLWAWRGWLGGFLGEDWERVVVDDIFFLLVFSGL
jgi:hypothetical protein